MISARTKQATIEHTHTFTHRHLAKQTPAKYLPLTERKKKVTKVQCQLIAKMCLQHENHYFTTQKPLKSNSYNNIILLIWSTNVIILFKYLAKRPVLQGMSVSAMVDW